MTSSFPGIEPIARIVELVIGRSFSSTDISVAPCVSVHSEGPTTHWTAVVRAANTTTTQANRVHRALATGPPIAWEVAFRERSSVGGETIPVLLSERPGGGRAGSRPFKMRVTKLKQRGNIHKYSCVAEVDGVTVAEAEVAAMVSFPEEDETGA